MNAPYGEEGKEMLGECGGGLLFYYFGILLLTLCFISGHPFVPSYLLFSVPPFFLHFIFSDFSSPHSFVWSAYPHFPSYLSRISPLIAAESVNIAGLRRAKGLTV